MSYNLTYTSSFKQVYSQKEIIINIYRNSGAGGDTVLKCVGFKVEAQGTEKKDDIIVSHKATLRFYSDINDTITNETFLTDFYDEWKVECFVGPINVFRGFIEPSEGGYEFKSRPYHIEITCTDGLGLLKNMPLSDVDGVDFDGRNSLIKYIAGALAKTNLELPIRTYCNIFEGSMNQDSDMFDQAKLHHRTFLKNPKEFVSCYEALEYILFGFTLFQWQDQWVISYRGEFFDSYGPIVYYVNYDKEGDLVGTPTEDTLEPINIGKNEAITPRDANQLISWQPSCVQVKTNYKYEIPENLVNNEKLQELGDIVFPVSGVGYAAYELVGWSQFHKDIPVQEAISNVTPYIRVETNPYGFELDRYYVIPFDPASNGSSLLRNYIMHDNNDFWVEAGDRMSIKASWKLSRKDAGPVRFMTVALNYFSPAVGGFSWLYLGTQGTWTANPTGPSFAPFFPAGIMKSGEDSSQWNTGGVDDFVIPNSGTLHIMFGLKYPGNAAGDAIYIKDIDITYNAFKDGDKRNVVKGDFWKTNQARNIKDIVEEDTKISDSIRRIFKGALWQESGAVLTNPTWYRRTNPLEQHHYKSLINWTKYQLYYRRFKRITGTFRGTLAKSDNNENFYRLCFHKHYCFVNDFQYRFYLLTGPVTIDYIENKFDATFVEAEGPNRGGNPNGDSRNFNYIF